MEQDDAATQPPADNPPNDMPSEGGDQPSEDPAEAPGPRGNPSVDEESLATSRKNRTRSRVTSARTN